VVERGSANDTTGKRDKKIRTLKGCQIERCSSLASLPGCNIFYATIPVVSLAKPRSTTG